MLTIVIERMGAKRPNSLIVNNILEFEGFLKMKALNVSKINQINLKPFNPFIKHFKSCSTLYRIQNFLILKYFLV